MSKGRAELGFGETTVSISKNIDGYMTCYMENHLTPHMSTSSTLMSTQTDIDD